MGTTGVLWPVVGQQREWAPRCFVTRTPGREQRGRCHWERDGICRRRTIRNAATVGAPSRANRPSNSARELGPLDPNNASSDARAINDAGVIAGISNKLATSGFVEARGVRYATPGSPTPTELLPESSQPNESHSVAAINTAGTVVGLYESDIGLANGDRPVKWLAGTNTPSFMTDVSSTPGGGGKSGVTAINNAGASIGYFQFYNPAGQSLGSRAVRFRLASEAYVRRGWLLARRR